MDNRGRIILLFCLAGLCCQVQTESDPKPFICEYYSDGTNVCYKEYRSATFEDHENPKRLQGFGVVALSEPIHGKWTGDEGFFSSSSIDKASPKKFVGGCEFGIAYDCTGAPRFSTDEQGNQAGVGGGMFRGNFYTGQPGGSIRVASMSAGFPTPKSST